MNVLTPIKDLPPSVESTVLLDPVLGLIARAMGDPKVSADKLEIFLRMRMEDARLRFNRAMSAAQAEMVPVVRDAPNTQTNSKYARLETIDAAIRPIYTKHGFCLSFNSEAIEGPNERVTCEVSHDGGYSKTFQLEAPPDTVGPLGKANKTPLHGLGSTVSYLRRYLVCMIFNIVLANDDNDGNRQQIQQAQPDIAELYDLLARCSAKPKAVAANERKFLDRMRLTEVRSLEEVAPREFPRLRNALLTKLNVMAQRANTGASK